jgi:hypothetical protein
MAHTTSGIPRGLADALRARRLVPFAGAGVSMAVRDTAGRRVFPSWKELLLRAADHADGEGRTADATLVRAQLGVDPPQYLEAAATARRALGPRWTDFLNREIDPPHRLVDPATLDLARAVWSLGAPLLLTTNYDRVLQWACPERHDLRVWGIESPAGLVEALRGDMTRPTIWHLHGHVDQITDIILTPDGYALLYPDNRSTVEPRYRAALATLQAFLAGRTLLFIGFSLDDAAFVAQLRWAHDTFAGAAGPHYVLMRAAEAGEARRRLAGLPVQVIEFADFGAPMLDALSAISRLAPGAP